MSSKKREKRRRGTECKGIRGMRWREGYLGKNEGEMNAVFFLSFLILDRRAFAFWT
jgi:hypothetical protein